MKKIDSAKIEQQITEVKEKNGEQNISKTYPEMAVIEYLKDNDIKENDMYINMDFLGLDLSKVPQENFSDIKVFIIPVLYVISSVVSIKFTTAMTKKKEDNKELRVDKENNENKEMDQEKMAAQMNKNMSLMMPILSVSISLVAPLGLALYWLVNNITMIIERLVLNKIFSKEEEENA